MSPITPPNADRTVNDAIAAIRSGDKGRGRALLTQALRLNPQNEQAWLWMTAIAETPEQQRECLERVLAINPQNKVARQGLKMFEMVQGPSITTPHAGQPSADAGRAIPRQESASVSGETSGDPAYGRNLTPQRCPQCNAALSHNASSCAFCGNRVAQTQEPASSSFHMPVSSYPKRSTLTRKEQLRLARESGKRTGAAHVVNPTTIIGVFVLIFGLTVMAVTRTEMFSLWELDLSNTAPFVLGMSLMALLLPLMFASAGLKLIIEGIQKHRFSQALRTAHAVADAPILDVWQEQQYEGEPYLVAWELTATDAKSQSTRFRQAQRISETLYHRLHQRDTVRVRFVPHQPELAVLDPQWVAAIGRHAAE